MASISENIRSVRRNIDKALKASGREHRVILIAVSKKMPGKKVREAFRAGQVEFGENYVQEALGKIEELDDLEGIKWHFIGSLQSNKVKHCLKSFATIQTVDREKIAIAISKEAVKNGIYSYPVLVEVNIAGEKSKSGIPPEAVPNFIKKISKLEGIRVKGLMTMPPYFEDPEGSRPYFIKLRELRDKISSMCVDNVEMNELSMGMSNDYALAVQEGATIVRVGTAIFGPRS